MATAPAPKSAPTEPASSTATTLVQEAPKAEEPANKTDVVMADVEVAKAEPNKNDEPADTSGAEKADSPTTGESSLAKDATVVEASLRTAFRPMLHLFE